MIKKRYCKNCKYLGLDGMFGLICDIGGNNKNYNCPQYEEDEDLITKMSNRIDKLEDDIWKLKKENKQLKKKLDSYKPLIFESENGYITLYEKKGDDV